MRSHSSGSAPATGPRSIRPALLTSVSRRPNRSTACRTAASAWMRSVMSASTASAVPRTLSISAARASRRSRRRATSAMEAPCSSWRAVAAPMPLLAPVTRAAVPVSSDSMGCRPVLGDTQDTHPVPVTPQKHEATDRPISAPSASLLKHFGTAQAGRPVIICMSALVQPSPTQAPANGTPQPCPTRPGRRAAPSCARTAPCAFSLGLPVPPPTRRGVIAPEGGANANRSSMMRGTFRLPVARSCLAWCALYAA